MNCFLSVVLRKPYLMAFVGCLPWLRFQSIFLLAEITPFYALGDFAVTSTAIQCSNYCCAWASEKLQI